MKKKATQLLFIILICGSIGCLSRRSYFEHDRDKQLFKQCAVLISDVQLSSDIDAKVQRALKLMTSYKSEQSKRIRICIAFCVTEMACVAKRTGLSPVVDILIGELSAIDLNGAAQDATTDGLVIAHYEALRAYLLGSTDGTNAHGVARSNFDVKAWSDLFIRNDITANISKLFEGDENQPIQLLEAGEYLRLWVLGSMASRMVALRMSLGSISNYEYSEEAIAAIDSVDSWKKKLSELYESHYTFSGIEWAFLDKSYRESTMNGGVSHYLGNVTTGVGVRGVGVIQKAPIKTGSVGGGVTSR